MNEDHSFKGFYLKKRMYVTAIEPDKPGLSLLPLLLVCSALICFNFFLYFSYLIYKKGIIIMQYTDDRNQRKKEETFKAFHEGSKLIMKAATHILIPSKNLHFLSPSHLVIRISENINIPFICYNLFTGSFEIPIL